MRRSIIILSLVTFILMCFMACEVQDKGVHKTIFAMDTVMTFTVYGDRAQEAVDAACARIFELDELLSVTKESSEVARLNAAEGEAVQVSLEVFDLIRTAKDYSERFDGFFDVTAASVVDLWGFYTDDFHIPSDDEIKSALSNVNYHYIQMDDSEHTVALENGAKLDLGAIAKGYAAEQIRLLFSEYGIRHAVVNLGGNVLVLGKKPDASEWLVAVRNPSQTNLQLGLLGVTDCALVTSGSYQRYFEEDGIRYHHIMDPKTGRPAESDLVSVTVITDDATYADVLSTALFVMGYEKALSYWESFSDFEAIFVLSFQERLYVLPVFSTFLENRIPLF